MYGTRTALFMDVVTPAVAATQGFAIERWGYPITLAMDGVAGLLCLATLPWIRRR